MRIGVVKQLGGDGYQAGVSESFARAVATLTAAGAEIVEVDISVDDAAKLVMSAGVIQPEDPRAGFHAMAASLRQAQVTGSEAAPETEKARREPARPDL